MFEGYYNIEKFSGLGASRGSSSSYSSQSGSRSSSSSYSSPSVGTSRSSSSSYSSQSDSGTTSQQITPEPQTQPQTQQQTQPQPQTQEEDAQLYINLIENGLNVIIQSLQEVNESNYNNVFGLHYCITGIWLPKLRDINPSAYSEYKSEIDALSDEIYNYKKRFETIKYSSDSLNEYQTVIEPKRQQASDVNQLNDTTKKSIAENLKDKLKNSGFLQNDENGGTKLTKKGLFGIIAIVVVVGVLLKK